MRGHIYCAIIDCYTDYIKVGCTMDINSRMGNLSSSHMDKFKCIFSIEVEQIKMYCIERNIHNDIVKAGYKRFKGREFFNCKPDDIKYIFDKYDNKLINNEKIDNIYLKENKKMKNYICEPCNYISNNKTNYEIHLHTKTHIDNITPDDKFCCNECLKIFNHKSNLYRHQKTCKQQKENNENYNDNQNEIINDINNDPKIEVLLLKQKVKFLEEKALLESKLTSKLIRAEMESKLIKEKNEMEKKLLIEQSKEKTKIIEKSNKKLLKSKDEQIDFIQKNNKESVRHAYSEGKMNALTFLTLSYNKTPKMPSLPKESDYVVKEVKSDKEINYWIKERPEFADEYIAERLLRTCFN